ncbi:alpha/beta hydrolase [Bradyrhizobium sp. McL0616]|uniref:alpha/beta hydrolase n=1 Tax=Bradyrhizobium sp. McL0616 TaxID=3415674 RepID=UPI003CFAEBF9
MLVPGVEFAESTSRVPVLVATTRERAAADTGDMFSRERASATSYAMISVSIPPDEARVVGAIQWPVVPPGDPRREFVTVSADYLDKAAFNAAVNSVARTSRRSKAMIFIHGFNNRFDDAVYRFAQIVQDSRAPVIPILFSWPSQGVVGLRAYARDSEVARDSSGSLDELIDQVALNPAVREVTVLCHSMGCLPTLNALQARARRSGKIGGKIKNVAMVAPDVEFEAFREQIHEMGSSRPRFALFLSQDDGALKLSKSIAGGLTRLGGVNPEEEPYKGELAHANIIVFDITHLQGRAHARAFEDATTVMGMIERRLAQGQQLAEDMSRRPAAGAASQ